MPILEILLATTLVASSPAPQPIQLTAEDGATIHGEHYAAGDPAAPIVLLFHQAGSNRGEYRTIAPRLVALGLQALALDQRSGAGRWGLDNQTVDARGESTSYLEALPDLEAALAWARTQSGSTGPVLVWGSSYSAALVFLLAAENPQAIDGVLSFSPGEYLGKPDLVAQHAAKVSQPVLILAPQNEREQAQVIHDAVDHEDKKLTVPEQAVHGSSMLIVDRNAAADDVWPVVETFLNRFAVSRD